MRLLLLSALVALAPIAYRGGQAVQDKPTQKPTYTQHVAPILRDRCLPCHTAGGAAPFSLTTYSQAKKWSAMSTQVVKSRRMPPWKPSQSGVFHGENRMSDEEAALLQAWEQGGTPLGPEVPPAPSVLPVALPKPDRVLQNERPYVITAGAPDEYRYFVLKNPYAETRWLRATEFRPGNPKVVHHVTVFVDGSGQAARLAQQNKDGQAGYPSTGGPKFNPTNIIGFWAPGMETRFTPEGTAFELKPGASLVVQVHYTSTGKAEIDRWSLGLHLADAPPKKPLLAGSIETDRLDIPANEKSFVVTLNSGVKEDGRLWAIMPHAHSLAKRVSAIAISPDGKQRALIDIADWDPAWQTLYWFKEPIRLEKGTIVRYTVTYDNSAANGRNPNQPPRRVQWGEDARAEMMLLAILYTRD